MSIEEATEQAVTECINEGILADFLKRNKAETIKVSIYEFDEKKYREAMLEEGREEGIEIGREEERTLFRHGLQKWYEAGIISEDAMKKIQDDMQESLQIP